MHIFRAAAGLCAAALLCGVLGAETTPRTIKSVEVVGADANIALETKAGQTLDTVKLSHDVKALWRSGSFADVRAETVEEDDAVRVLFRVRSVQTFRIRKVEVKPPTPGIDVQLKPESEITAMGAQQIGAQVRKRLETSGFAFAKVETKLLPVHGGHADLQILIDQGRKTDVDGVSLSGDLGTPGESARKALKWTRGTTIVPRVGGLWNGWRLRPGYSADGVQYDLANLQSFYYKHGYFDATVKADPADLALEKTRLNFTIRAGSRYAIRSIDVIGEDGITLIHPGSDSTFPARDVCKTLLDERRKAERDGVLDFTAKIEVHDLPSTAADDRKWVDLIATVQRGAAYRVGRIEFRGVRSFSDATVRRAFVLDEGDLLDQTLLRKSLARLNNTGLFEPLSEGNVLMNTPPGADHADITVDLREKKMRHWLLSGPVGPMSFAGPLSFAVGTRLPPWGQRLIELSTYALSMNLMLFPKPLGQFIPGLPNSRFIAAATITRPLLPGQRFLSGFSIPISPQLGWRGMATGFLVSQARGVLNGIFAADRADTPALPVTISHAVAGRDPEVERQGTLYCEAPAAKLDSIRRAAGIGTNLLFAFAPF